MVASIKKSGGPPQYSFDDYKSMLSLVSRSRMCSMEGYSTYPARSPHAKMCHVEQDSGERMSAAPLSSATGTSDKMRRLYNELLIDLHVIFENEWD
jgi:hypothetical protein